MINLIGFDIETVPINLEDWTPIKEDFLKRKLDSYQGEDKEKESIKIRSINPYLGKIICIGVYEESDRFPQGQANYFVEDGFSYEKDLLKDFWEYIEGFNGLFVSFNGLSFDVPFIRARSWHHKIQMRNSRFLQLRRFSTDPHFDVMRIFSNWEMRGVLNLEQMCEFFGITSSKKGKVKAENVHIAFQEGRIKEIADYCIDDVRATVSIFKEMISNQ